MTRGVLALGGLLILLCPALAMAQYEPPSSTTDTEPSENAAYRWGVSLGIGVGQQYAGLGGNLSVYFPVFDTPLTLAPVVGGGVASVEACCTEWAYSAGAMLLWGRNHRLVLSALYGPADFEKVPQPSGSQRGNVLYGIIGLAGYELLTSGGFYMRWLVGAAHPLDTPEIDTDDILPAVTMGLGWKI